MRNVKRGLNIFGYRVPDPTAFSKASPVSALVRMALGDTFRCLKISPETLDSLTDKVLLALNGASCGRDLERDLHYLCNTDVSPGNLRVALDERARLIAEQVKPHLQGQRLLDLGCGDGLVLQDLSNYGYDVLLADVLNYVDPRVIFPFHLLTDGKLTGIKGSFDTVLLLTVLHHANDPIQIVSGLIDLKPKRVIVIESVINKPLAQGALACLLREQDFKTRFAFAAFADWFYNRVLHQDVPVPYNFGCISDWNALFTRYGFRTTLTENLGIDQRLVPEVHELLVYEPS